MNKWSIYAAALILINAVSRAYAQSITLPNPLGTDSLTNVVNKVTNGLLMVATPIVGIMVLIGGFRIMTAQGNKEHVEEGKKIITNAAIGFAIILLAKSVVVIIRQLLG
ncbi:MAG: pilin [Candidatus Liptonbacteria bacterium]